MVEFDCMKPITRRSKLRDQVLPVLVVELKEFRLLFRAIFSVSFKLFDVDHWMMSARKRVPSWLVIASSPSSSDQPWVAWKSGQGDSRRSSAIRMVRCWDQHDGFVSLGVDQLLQFSDGYVSHQIT
jgi:hypothetical protein